MDDGSLNFKAVINDTQYNAAIISMQDKMRTFTDTSVRETSKIDNALLRVGSAATAFFTFQQGAQLINAMIRVRGEFQQLEIAFTTMLQSKEKASQLMSEMVSLAAKTPFGLNEIAGSAKQLMAYGFAAEDLTENITMLGNVASGVGSQVDDLIYLYGTLKASGRVTQMDINQFAGRGIPIYAELAKVLNTNVDAVRDLVSSGSVGFPEIEKAFQSMTSKGGLFFNLMEAQSASLTGQISNLQDSLTQMFNEIGQSKEGIASSAISGLAYLVEHYKEIGKILSVLISVYGTYRAAVILTNAIEKARYLTTLQLGAAQGTVTIATALQTQATNLLAAAQANLNRILLLNPYVLIATAVAGLAASIYFLRDTTTEAELAQKQLAGALDRVAEKTDVLKNKAQNLVETINDNNQVLATQILAYQQLQQLFPARLSNLDLEAFKLMSTADRMKLLNGLVQDFSLDNMTKEYDKAIEKVKQLSTITIQLGDGTTSTQDNTMSKEYKAAVIAAENLKAEISKIEEAEKLANMTASERIEYLQAQADELKHQITLFGQNNDQIKIAADGSIELSKLFNNFTILPLINQFNILNAQINSAKKAIDATATLTKPMEYKERSAKLRSEAENEADPSKRKALLKQADADNKAYKNMMGEVDKSAISAANKAEKAQERAAGQRKQFIDSLIEAERKQTLAQMVESEKQVEDIKDKYAKMREAAKKAGAASTDILNRIDNLEKVDIGNAVYENNTDKIFETLDKQKQTWLDFENYKSQVGEAEAAKRFNIDKSYLDRLYELESTFKAEPKNAQSEKRLTTIATYIADENKRLYDAETAQKAKALTDFASYQQKREALIKQYSESEKVLGSEITEGQRQELAYQRQIALGQLADEYSERLIQSKSFFNGLVLESKNAVTAQIENIKKLLEQTGLDENVRKQLEADLKKTQDLLQVDPAELKFKQLSSELEDIDAQLKALDSNTATQDSINKRIDLMVQRTRKVQEITEVTVTSIDKILNKLIKTAPALNSLGEMLQSLGADSSLAEIGIGLSTIASGLDNIIAKIKDIKKNGTTSTEAYTAAAQFTFQIVTSLVTAAKQRKDIEEDFYRSALNLQSQYTLGLIEQQRLASELNENIFLTNYMGRAKDAMQASLTAINVYQKALDKLNEGRAKERQKNAIDGKAAGQLALSGASTGAVLGSLIAPGIGTAIGAVVGGIAGLIGGLFSKKKKDVWGGLLQQWPELIATTKDGYKELNVELAKALLANNQLDDKTKTLVQNALDAKDAYKEAYKQMTDVVKDLAGNLGNDLRTSLTEAWKAGEDGAKAFGQTVDKVLEDIIANILFEQVFGNMFTQLQKDLTDDFVNGSIGDITNTMATFFNANKDNIDKYNALMEIAAAQAKASGLDIFQKTSNLKNDSDPLPSSVKAITQESASIISGYLNAIRIQQVDGISIIRLILAAQVETAQNTRYNKYLESIDKKLGTLQNDSQRQFGII